MIITIDGSDYKLPASLSEITLNDRIEFDRLYGKELREKRSQFIDKVDELDFAEYQIDLACKTVSHFGKIPLEIIQNTAVDDVLIVYNTAMEAFSEEVNFSDDKVLQTDFTWKGIEWTIAAPTLKQDSKMTFGEFIDAKQSVLNMRDLGEERWSSLLPLACIYLRKKGEPYDKEFAIDGGARMELMKTLPLSIAMEVAFFLNISISTYLNTSLYSGQARPSLEASS